MPIIPNSISVSNQAPQGERKVHKLFEKLYGDIDDVYVWYEPPGLDVNGSFSGTEKKLTDFIIFSQEFGIINLEVKDWKLSQIIKADQTYWELEVEERKSINKQSPIVQTQKCAYGIKNGLVKEMLLVHQEGVHKNKLLFPFAYGVVFTKIDREKFRERGFFNGLVDERLVLFREDIEFDISEKDERLKFEKKLKNMFIQARYDFEFLNRKQIDVLRKTIWPELVVTPVRESSINKQANDFKILDLQQENFAKSLGDGHYLIKGVAGSGKTLVLAYRARYLRKTMPYAKILFVSFNISLRKYVESMIKNLMDTRDLANIDILHFHELVKVQTGQNVQRLKNQSQEDYDEMVGSFLRNAVLLNTIKTKYDIILIDEAQDFSTLWLKGICGLLSENDSMTIAYDPAQDHAGRSRVWKEAGVKIVGGQRSRKLKESYRNTSEILKLAASFRGFDEYIESENEELDDIIKPVIIERHGELPIIKKITNNQLIFSEIKNEIQSLCKDGKYKFGDFAIISCSSGTTAYITGTPNLLDSVPMQFYFTRQQRLNLDVSEDTVKFITVESSRGLEWKVVYLLGVEDMPRPERIRKFEEVLIYIGITRAQEYLRVYYKSESDFIKKLLAVNNKI